MGSGPVLWRNIASSDLPARYMDRGDIMKASKLFIGALAATFAIIAVSAALPSQTRTQQAEAQQQSDKYDGDCTGDEIAGRCADKCPPPTKDGAYHERGIDKQTGAVVCGFTYYNECPYAAAYSADDPMCDKLGEQQLKHKTAQPSQEAQIWGGK